MLKEFDVLAEAEAFNPSKTRWRNFAVSRIEGIERAIILVQLGD
jgi:limonene-1,2-epoxide hydrolase